MTAPLTVSAPGKLFLFGEYGVLEGGRAIVAAIDRRAVGRIDPDAPEPSGVVAEVLRRACRPELRLQIDTHQLSSARTLDGAARAKLGLGSSAAAAVVTAALAANDPKEALGIALDGHSAAQGGRGSGLDVVASHHGGVIFARRAGMQLQALRPTLPDGLFMTIAYVGKSALTSELVRSARLDPSFFSFAREVSELAERAASAWAEGDADLLIELASRHTERLEELTRSSGAPIMTPALSRLAERAKLIGAAAKPSGAGGGDVAIILSRDDGPVRALLAELDFELIEALIDPRGLDQG